MQESRLFAKFQGAVTNCRRFPVPTLSDSGSEAFSNTESKNFGGPIWVGPDFAPADFTCLSDLRFNKIYSGIYWESEWKFLPRPREAFRDFSLFS